MKNIIALAAIAGLVGGAAGSFALNSLTAPTTSADANTSPVALNPVGSGDSAELETEVAALRRENDELTLRMVALESRSSRTAQPVDTDDAYAADLAGMQEQLAELARALENPQSAQSAGLRDLVATTLGDVREQEEADQRAEREQREVDRIVERMDRYAQDLGLDGVQKQSMQDTLLSESTKRNELFTSMRSGDVPREQVREAFGEIRETTQATLSNILTGTQLEQYNEMSNDRWGGGGGGGGRGGRGGRGDA